MKFEDKANEIIDEGRNNPDVNDIFTATERMLNELSAKSTLGNALKQFGSKESQKMRDQLLDAIVNFRESLSRDWDDEGVYR